MAYNPWGTFGTGTINVVGGGTTTPTTTTTTTSAGTTSQDRINIGFGPRLGQAPSSTGGFQWTGQTAITPDYYLSRRVDFTKEFIGLPSLAQTTGIATTTTAVGEDAELGKKKESSITGLCHNCWKSNVEISDTYDILCVDCVGRHD